MTILISPDETYMPQSRDVPIVGRTYTLEDAATGSNAQNRAFHALVQEYWRSGAHSYEARSFIDFRNQIKKHLGAGFESFAYIGERDGRPVIMDAPTWEDVPAEIRNDPSRRDLVRGRLLSWSDYSKKQRTETIDRLIAEMIQVGVDTKKFHEILAGMEREEQES